MSLPSFTTRSIVPFHKRGIDVPAIPVLPVILANRGRPLPFILQAVVDSGADMAMLSEDLAVGLGIDLKAHPTRPANNPINRRGVEAPEVRITLAIEGKEFEDDVLFVPSPDNEPNPETWGLLGRADVFREFFFAFDQRNERLLIADY